MRKITLAVRRGHLFQLKQGPVEDLHESSELIHGKVKVGPAQTDTNTVRTTAGNAKAG